MYNTELLSYVVNLRFALSCAYICHNLCSNNIIYASTLLIKDLLRKFRMFSLWQNVNYKPRDWIGRTTFQSLEYLTIHDIVTLPDPFPCAYWSMGEKTTLYLVNLHQLQCIICFPQIADMDICFSTFYETQTSRPAIFFPLM